MRSSLFFLSSVLLGCAFAAPTTSSSEQEPESDPAPFEGYGYIKTWHEHGPHEGKKFGCVDSSGFLSHDPDRHCAKLRIERDGPDGSFQIHVGDSQQRCGGRYFGCHGKNWGGPWYYTNDGDRLVNPFADDPAKDTLFYSELYYWLDGGSGQVNSVPTSGWRVPISLRWEAA